MFKCSGLKVESRKTKLKYFKIIHKYSTLEYLNDDEWLSGIFSTDSFKRTKNEWII